MADLDQRHVIGRLTLRAENVAGLEKARLGRGQQITLLFLGQTAQQDRRRQVIRLSAAPGFPDECQPDPVGAGLVDREIAVGRLPHVADDADA
jgi:hypothetical protein